MVTPIISILVFILFFSTPTFRTERKIILATRGQKQEEIGVRESFWMGHSTSPAWAERTPRGKYPAEFDAEVKQSLDNIDAVLKEAGMSPDDVVSVQVYLTDFDQFQRMNAVYTSYFKAPRPTRTTVVVAKLVGPDGSRSRPPPGSNCVIVAGLR